MAVLWLSLFFVPVVVFAVVFFLLCLSMVRFQVVVFDDERRVMFDYLSTLLGFLFSV